MSEPKIVADFLAIALLDPSAMSEPKIVADFLAIAPKTTIPLSFRSRAL